MGLWPETMVRTGGEVYTEMARNYAPPVEHDQIPQIDPKKQDILRYQKLDLPKDYKIGRDMPLEYDAMLSQLTNTAGYKASKAQELYSLN